MELATLNTGVYTPVVLKPLYSLGFYEASLGMYIMSFGLFPQSSLGMAFSRPLTPADKEARTP